MPTAAKLISGILMAGLGWWVANAIIPYLPPETRIGLFREISAVIGFFVGWRFLGRRAVEGFVAAIGFGIGAAAFLVLWMLLVFSGIEMLRRAFRKSYGGPLEALQGMIDVSIGYLVYLSPIEVATALVGGGVMIGVIAFLVARRWR